MTAQAKMRVEPVFSAQPSCHVSQNRGAKTDTYSSKASYLVALAIETVILEDVLNSLLQIIIYSGIVDFGGL